MNVPVLGDPKMRRFTSKMLEDKAAVVTVSRGPAPDKVLAWLTAAGGKPVTVLPGKMVWAMRGAMDLVAGAKRHTAKGWQKIVQECSPPLTSVRPADLVVPRRDAAGDDGRGRGRGGRRRDGGRPREAPELSGASRRRTTLESVSEASMGETV